MQKNSEGFHDFSMADAMRLAQSDAGQQLFALLQSTNGQQLQAAMAQASVSSPPRHITILPLRYTPAIRCCPTPEPSRLPFCWHQQYGHCPARMAAYTPK